MNPDDAAVKNANKPTEPMSKSAKKNAKRKEKKKQQEVPPSIQSVTKSMQDTNIKEQPNKSDSHSEVKQSNTSGGDNDKQDVTKKLRQLRKKLKQIEDLERRISSGELKEPEKEQLEKIAKKNSVLNEIEDLEMELEDS